MSSRSLISGYSNSIMSRSLISVVILPDNSPLLSDRTNIDYETVTSLVNTDIIEYVEKNYGRHSASKNYHLMDNSVGQYNLIYWYVQNILNSISTPELVTLITAIKELLASSYNSIGLHKDNIIQNITISTLTDKVQDILSNKNKDVLLQQNNPGSLTITQTFTLAPVYNYYISIYGMPLQGNGFNPLKISYIAEILTSINIEPYN